MDGINVLKFPAQNVSDSKKKTKEWQKANLDAGEKMLAQDNSSLRTSFYNKQVNYNLRRNILNEADISATVNPHHLEISKFPAKMQHIGLGNSKINLLIGEEKRRTDRYDYKAFISSSDEEGISAKERAMKEFMLSELEAKMSAGVPEDQMEQVLAEIQKKSKYEFQDVREIVANKILYYEYLNNEMKHKFLTCFEDLLIVGEEIMCIEEAGNKLNVRRVDPRRFFTIQSPESYRVEESDAIMEFTYMSPGQIVDTYYDKLPDDAIEKMQDGSMGDTKNFGNVRQMLNRDLSIEERYGNSEEGDITLLNTTAAYQMGSAQDRVGNIRVMRMCWKSLRRLGKLPWYDEYGQEQFELIDESFKPFLSKEEAARVSWFTVNEWWEGVRIGEDIDINVRPIPYQGRSHANLSESYPPYVGLYASAGGNNRAFSLMDTVKPLDYLYDIYSYRRELAMAAYHGPILAFNASMIPSEWDPKEWMYYVTTMKMMPLDPTNEVLKGPSQGKSAGAYNTITAQAINLEMGNFIQQHTLMMQQIKEDMDIISGINNYRQGQIKSDSSVGTSEMAYSASNSMTEKLFHLHAMFKKRVMTKILEVAKYVWKKNPKNAQYVLDDLGTEMITLYDEFFESEYDIHVANSSADEELMQALKQLAHAAMQNGQATFKQIIEIYKTDSIASVARKLEAAEQEAQQRAQQAQEAQNEHEAQLKQAEIQEKAADRQFKYDEMQNDNVNQQLDRETKIQIETIKALGFAQDTDVNQNAVPDVMEQAKLSLETQKLSFEQAAKREELVMKGEAEKLKSATEDKKLKLKEKELEAKKEIEKLKIKQTEVQNKSQERINNKNAEIKLKEIEAKKAIARKSAAK